jgi:hypothetical protein
LGVAIGTEGNNPENDEKPPPTIIKTSRAAREKFPKWLKTAFCYYCDPCPDPRGALGKLMSPGRKVFSKSKSEK